jgi:hypothetical protein
VRRDRAEAFGIDTAPTGRLLPSWTAAGFEAFEMAALRLAPLRFDRPRRPHTARSASTSSICAAMPTPS